ncbi:hypothetical protein [Pseudomonas syringae]|uniref:hypothetical protein n=1 Tax=Pseudomonas syringae TaxID=317 RepID=UPI0022495E8B|nr:hypothetical protein [Pseudomonas syringae]UZS70490.1 hypothetical protein OQB65_08860 [Pseudomonas syringae]
MATTGSRGLAIGRISKQKYETGRQASQQLRAADSSFKACVTNRKLLKGKIHECNFIYFRLGKIQWQLFGFDFVLISKYIFNRQYFSGFCVFKGINLLFKKQSDHSVFWFLDDFTWGRVLISESIADA